MFIINLLMLSTKIKNLHSKSSTKIFTLRCQQTASATSVIATACPNTIIFCWFTIVDVPSSRPFHVIMLFILIKNRFLQAMNTLFKPGTKLVINKDKQHLPIIEKVSLSPEEFRFHLRSKRDLYNHLKFDCESCSLIFWLSAATVAILFNITNPLSQKNSERSQDCMSNPQKCSIGS